MAEVNLRLTIRSLITIMPICLVSTFDKEMGSILGTTFSWVPAKCSNIAHGLAIQLNGCFSLSSFYMAIPHAPVLHPSIVLDPHVQVLICCVMSQWEHHTTQETVTQLLYPFMFYNSNCIGTPNRFPMHRPYGNRELYVGGVLGCVYDYWYEKQVIGVRNRWNE